MSTKPSLILFFSIAFAFFIMVPPFLDQPFPAFNLMHWADVFDVLTPLVLIPLYWLLFTHAGRSSPRLSLGLTFLVLVALWTEGQGMHLSANSIGNLLGKGQSDVHRLVHFYDEVLSHYLWHIAIVGLSMLIMVEHRADPSLETSTSWGYAVPSAILYGFTYFAAINEGGTVSFGLPAAILIALGLVARRRAQLRTSTLTAFFFLAYLLSLILFGSWFAYWGSFPEFSETGLI